MNQNKPIDQTTKTSATTPKRPNETGSISVQGFVKIFDPMTKRVFVEKRA